jgi:Na+-driven multidrug efflux pump
MGAMGLVYAFFGEPLLRIFSSEPEVLAQGVPAMLVLAIASPIWATQMVLSGALRGAGDTRFPMVVTLVTGWLIRVPVGFLLGIPLALGLAGIYAGAVGDAVVGLLMVVWRYRRGGWREMRI